MFDQYLVSLFWISSVLSTTGLIGSMNPSNTAEVVFTSVTMVLNLTVYSYALGQIADAVRMRSAASALLARCASAAPSWHPGRAGQDWPSAGASVGRWRAVHVQAGCQRGIELASRVAGGGVG